MGLGAGGVQVVRAPILEMGVGVLLFPRSRPVTLGQAPPVVAAVQRVKKGLELVHRHRERVHVVVRAVGEVLALARERDLGGEHRDGDGVLRARVAEVLELEDQVVLHVVLAHLRVVKVPAARLAVAERELRLPEVVHVIVRDGGGRVQRLGARRAHGQLRGDDLVRRGVPAAEHAQVDLLARQRVAHLRVRLGLVLADVHKRRDELQRNVVVPHHDLQVARVLH